VKKAGKLTNDKAAFARLASSCARPRLFSTLSSTTRMKVALKDVFGYKR